MVSGVKKRLINVINQIVYVDDYEAEDCIFSQKYFISPVAMTYILLEIGKEFEFEITDEFVDALEMCTFSQLEELITQYSK